MDAHGRYSISRNYALPAQCICGKSGNSTDGLVDTGLDAPDYGVVYLCEDCAREIGRLVGAYPEEIYAGRIKELEDALEAKIIQELKQSQKLLALEKILDGIGILADLNCSYPGAISSISVETSPDINSGDPLPFTEEDSSTDSSGSGVSEGSSKSTRRRNKETDKSSAKQESGDIRPSTESESATAALGLEFLNTDGD